MGGSTAGKRRIWHRSTTVLLAAGLLALGSARAGDIRVLPPAAGAVVQPSDLDSLRATALANNAAIAAAKASLASAVAGQQGVENLHVPTAVQPDLPFRRKQAALGVQAADAGVRNAELQVVFGVQYAYVSYLYAKEQERLARESVDEKAGSQNLAYLSKRVREVVAQNAKADKGEKVDRIDTDLKERDALFLGGVVSFARSRLAEAETGSRRALSALREAVGVGCDFPRHLKHQRLLDVKRPAELRQLIDLALANRPDLLAASINAQVTDLEVQAQASRHSLNVRTFASGADLHAIPLPAGRYDQEYRPGVIGPEMPPFLSGKKCDRVARAAALASRAGSVRDKARALIILEVEQAFLRFEEAAAKLAALTRSAAQLNVAMNGKKDKDGKEVIEGAANRLEKTRFEVGSKAALDDLLKFGQVSSLVRVQANEARYQYLIALITLERATGAAFRADLSSAPEVTDE